MYFLKTFGDKCVFAMCLSLSHFIVYRGGPRIPSRGVPTWGGGGKAPIYDFAKFSKNYMKL